MEQSGFLPLLAAGLICIQASEDCRVNTSRFPSRITSGVSGRLQNTGWRILAARAGVVGVGAVQPEMFLVLFFLPLFASSLPNKFCGRRLRDNLARAVLVKQMLKAAVWCFGGCVSKHCPVPVSHSSSLALALFPASLRCPVCLPHLGPPCHSSGCIPFLCSSPCCSPLLSLLLSPTLSGFIPVPSLLASSSLQRKGTFMNQHKTRSSCSSKTHPHAQGAPSPAPLRVLGLC